MYTGLSRETAEQHAKSFQGLTAALFPAPSRCSHGMPTRRCPSSRTSPPPSGPRSAGQFLAQILVHRLVEAGWTLEALSGEPVVAGRDDQHFDPAPLLGEIDQAA